MIGGNSSFVVVVWERWGERGWGRLFEMIKGRVS